MRHYVLAAVTLITAAIGHGQDRPPTQQEIWQGRLYEWMADMVVARDELIQDGYVCVMEGIEIKSHTSFLSGGQGASPFTGAEPKGKPVSIVKTPIPNEMPFIRIYSRRGMYDDYRAELSILPPSQWSPNGSQRHVWRETQNIGGKLDRFRRLELGDRRFKVPTWHYREGMVFKQWINEGVAGASPRIDAFTPYDSFTLPLGLFASTVSVWKATPIEKTLYRLDPEKIEPASVDSMRSTWRYGASGWETEMKLKHSRQHKWMLVDASLDTTKRPKGWEKVTRFSHLRLFDWKDRKAKRDSERSYLLPGMAEFGHNISGRKDETVTYYVKLHWLIGSDVPSKLFEPNTNDPRAAVLDKVGIEYLRMGEDGFLQSPAPYYEPPEELIERFRVSD